MLEKANAKYRYTLIYKAKKLDLYIFINQRLSKNIYLSSLDKDSLKLEIPKFFSKKDLDSFIETNKVNFFKFKDKQKDKRFLKPLSKEEFKEAKTKLINKAQDFYSSLDKSIISERPKRIEARAQKTRWGSCSTKGTISLNVYLLQLDESLQEYILLHELVHLDYPHHQKSFWKTLEKLCPNAKAKSKALNKYLIP